MNRLHEDMVSWTQEYFKQSKGKKAIIGISGGKDSTVCAKILVDSLGKENVIGVLMPQGVQHDIDVSKKVVEWLGIKSHEINIGSTVTELLSQAALFSDLKATENKVVTSNLPARIRMSTLYAVSACYEGGRVVNTCNRSEDYVGYATKFGDAAGDFGLLQDLTVTEILALGREIGIPEEFISKTPEDGLSGLTDEENLGFSYAELDEYLLSKGEKVEKFDKLYEIHKHKLLPMPLYKKTEAVVEYEDQRGW